MEIFFYKAQPKKRMTTWLALTQKANKTKPKNKERSKETIKHTGEKTNNDLTRHEKLAEEKNKRSYRKTMEGTKNSVVAEL
jgi:protein required for attachment to host cells